ncbi:MAG TPA: type 1 glutamine amidotransferase [Gammaproteobacteria bacterium]|jgi:GMP synthase-like glutamine amidotransferase
MQPIWIFRHVDCEGPGYLGRVLERHGIDYRLIAIDRGDPIPENVNGTSALVFMGGPMSANDPDDWIQRELALIRVAAGQRLPLLGHCLGGQLISKALGAVVKPNPVTEIGWHPVERFKDAAAGAWLENLGFPVELFHWHGETFEWPNKAVPLFKSRFCQNQAYALDNILALQCHVEMLPEMVTQWAEAYTDQISQPSESIQSRAEMTENLGIRIARAQRVADTLYRQWLIRGGFNIN